MIDDSEEKAKGNLMNYRVLEPDEYYKVKHIFETQGGQLPDPGMSFITVAEDPLGQIQGFLVCQLQFHAEPLYLSSPHVNFRRLVETMEAEIKQNLNGEKVMNYYAFIPNPQIGAMAESIGMEDQGWSVMKKEVRV